MNTIKLLLEVLERLPLRKSWRWSQIIQHVSQNGMSSLPIVTLSTSFAGIVVTHQIVWHMKSSLHDISMLPGFTGQFIFRELGIAIPAFLMVSKVGASTAAEIGSMKVTEQIDALKLLGIDPIQYLVFPRFIASLISGACITIIAVSITLACAIMVASVNYHIAVSEFFNALRHFLSYKDILCALVKGTIYGAVIPIISSSFGFHCKGGAEGVGTATTHSVVASTTVIIVLDLILTYLFTWIL